MSAQPGTAPSPLAQPRPPRPTSGPDREMEAQEICGQFTQALVVMDTLTRTLVLDGTLPRWQMPIGTTTVACEPLSFTDNYGSQLDRNGICDEKAATVIVMVTDTYRWAALPASKEKSPPDRSPPGNWSPDKDKRPSFSAAEKPEQEWRSQDVEATKRDIYYGGFKPGFCRETRLSSVAPDFQQGDWVRYTMPLNAFDWRTPTWSTATASIFKGCSTAISALKVDELELKNTQGWDQTLCIDQASAHHTTEKVDNGHIALAPHLKHLVLHEY
eukprot:gene20798-27630_t